MMLPNILKESSEVPLFNLNISLNDWHGPFAHISSLVMAAEKVKKNLHLVGERHVTSKGDVKNGKIDGLHTFQAEMDLYQEGHIHYGPNQRILSFIQPRIVNYHDLPKHPRYTLKGLYETLPQRCRNDPLSQIEALSQEFTTREIAFGSIAKHSKTILKLLENKYRREVSNQ